jgi:hypothetical protein
VREQLLVWGHVYYGNAVSADCFVVAVALRRPSETLSTGKENDKTEKSDEKLEKASNRVTIRARVRPRDIERKPFILQRSFDLDEIRSTIPDPPMTPASSRRESVSVELLSPSAAVTPRSAAFRQRTSSTSSHGETLTGGKDGKDGSGESINRNLIRGANALPMRKFWSHPPGVCVMTSHH